MLNCGCIDGSRNLYRSRILKFEKFSGPDPDSKILEQDRSRKKWPPLMSSTSLWCGSVRRGISRNAANVANNYFHDLLFTFSVFRHLISIPHKSPIVTIFSTWQRYSLWECLVLRLQLQFKILTLFTNAVNCNWFDDLW